MFLVLAALVVTTPNASAAADAPTDAKAQALLAKHREYVGWQLYDGTFRSMRVFSSVTDEKGKKTADITESIVGVIFHETYTSLDRDEITWHQGYTGSIFWQSLTSGFTTPVYGASAKEMASYTMLIQEGTSGLPGKFLGQKTIDGKQVSLVRVALKNGDPIDLYIDPSTGAYVQATIDPDGPNDTTYHIVSYDDLEPGKKIIGSYRIDDDKSLYTNTRFEPNATVTDEELHPPAPTASWQFTSADAVPIRLTYDRILVDATVNGVKGTFIFDTGSDAIRLDDRFADRAHVETLKGKSTSLSLYGTSKEQVRRIADMDFGNASLHNVLAYSEDFEHYDYRGLDAKGYAGLVGYDFLAGAIVKLDVYDSKMTILDPNTDLSSLQSLPINLDLSDGELTVPMTLDHTATINAILDTGNPGSILFSYDLVKKHWPFNPHTLTLGPIQYTIGSWESCCFSETYALLGYDFLKHFDFVFDYPHGRMFISPNKN